MLTVSRRKYKITNCHSIFTVVTCFLLQVFIVRIVEIMYCGGIKLTLAPDYYFSFCNTVESEE